jgi:O-antigen ligase
VVVFFLASASAAIIALSAALMPYLFLRPRDALWLAPAFMIIAVTVAPQTYRFLGEGTPPEFYYWAIGLFLITVPLTVRVLFQRQWSVFPKKHSAVRPWPRALVAFVVVSVAAAMEGLRGGYDASYVVRQFYGAVLFFVYFMGALAFIQEPQGIATVIRRVRRFALLSCLLAVWWYFQELESFVLFKQHLVAYSVSLAAFSVGEFLFTRSLRARLFLALQVALLALPAVLARGRGALGALFIVAIAGLGFMTSSQKKRVVVVAAAIVLMMLGITADLFTPIAEYTSRIELLGGVIPQTVRDDPSYLGRVNQMNSAIEVVLESPLLGLGLGSTLTFYNPGYDSFQTEALVDHGYAYLLSKFGLLGLVTFGALVFSVLRRSGMAPSDATHLGLLLVLLFNLILMINGPIWLHFLTAAWVGTTVGLLYRVGVFRAEGLANKQAWAPPTDQLSR